MNKWILAASIGMLFIALAILPSDCDGSETASDGSVYDYETHGTAHPDYYCEITHVDTEQTILRTPAVLEGYDVRVLSSNAFTGCKMGSVILPKNLEIIEEGAFTGCPFLKDAYFMGDRPQMGGAFPEGVIFHYIPGRDGWDDAAPIPVVTDDDVEYAILPDGPTVIGGKPIDGILTVKDEIGGSKVMLIDHYSFAGTMTEDGTVDRRSDILAVHLPAGIESIGQRAFYYNDLEDIDLPDSLRYVQDEAFRACHDLKNIKIKSNLEYVGFEAFRDCHSITELSIPNTVEHIGDGAFYICEGLVRLYVDADIAPRMFGWCVSLEEVELGEDVATIGSMGFYRCESLKSIDIPAGVTEIGSEAFRDCISLERIGLGNVEEIARSAFRECESLSSLDLPSTLSSIGGYAFADCTGLKDIFAYGKAPSGDGTAFLNVEATVHCHETDLESWENSGFGLMVNGDLKGESSDFLIIAAVSVAVLFILAVSVAAILRMKR
jgi:hypothetical protein